MAVTHKLIPAALVDASNIEPMSIFLSELSDGNTGTGMHTDVGNGLLIMSMSDLESQPLLGSTISINVKSNVDTKSVIILSVSYDSGDSYNGIASYVISEDDESSFTFATYNGASEAGDTDQLNQSQVNDMFIAIQASVGGTMVHDVNITIDNGKGGRIRIDSRVFFRQGRVRI